MIDERKVPVLTIADIADCIGLPAASLHLARNSAVEAFRIRPTSGESTRDHLWSFLDGLRLFVVAAVAEETAPRERRDLYDALTYDLVNAALAGTQIWAAIFPAGQGGYIGPNPLEEIKRGFFTARVIDVTATVNQWKELLFNRMQKKVAGK